MFGRNIRIVVACFFCVSAPLLAQTLRIAAAADLGPAFKELAAGFEKQYGVKTNIILGSSGNFFAQIENGAPYDIFFSADKDYAKKLQDAGVADSLQTYAEGSIVLWVRNDSRLDLTHGMNSLVDPSIRKIAIADPTHAPYGRAAMSALEHFGLAEKVRAKLVLGENIAQTMQFVQTGNADVGIVALALALSPALKQEGRYWEMPRDAYPRIEQSVVIIKKTENRKAAQMFLAYMKTDTAKKIMRTNGFRVPEPAAK